VIPDHPHLARRSSGWKVGLPGALSATCLTGMASKKPLGAQHLAFPGARMEVGVFGTDSTSSEMDLGGRGSLPTLLPPLRVAPPRDPSSSQMLPLL